jgi:hypothetical protein
MIITRKSVPVLPVGNRCNRSPNVRSNTVVSSSANMTYTSRPQQKRRKKWIGIGFRASCLSIDAPNHKARYNEILRTVPGTTTYYIHQKVRTQGRQKLNLRFCIGSRSTVVLSVEYKKKHISMKPQQNPIHRFGEQRFAFNRRMCKKTQILESFRAYDALHSTDSTSAR